MIAWAAMYGGIGLGAAAVLIRPVAARLGPGWIARIARFGPAVAVIAVLIAATLAHGAPTTQARAWLWVETIAQRDAIGVVLLALLGAIGVVAPPSTGGRAASALIGGLTIGAVPTALLLCPKAESPSEAARIAMSATAIGLLSPFGSTSALLAPSAPHLPWVLAAIAGVLASLPAEDRGPARLTASGWAAALGLIVALGVDRTAGLALAVAGSAIVAARQRPDVTEAARLQPERAAVAVLAAVGAHIAGAAALAGLTLAQAGLPSRWDAPLSAVIGSIGDPSAFALFLGRAAALDPSLAERAPAIAIGLAIAPGVAMGIAVHAKGVSALKYAVLPALVMIGAAVAALAA